MHGRTGGGGEGLGGGGVVPLSVRRRFLYIFYFRPTVVVFAVVYFA